MYLFLQKSYVCKNLLIKLEADPNLIKCLVHCLGPTLETSRQTWQEMTRLYFQEDPGLVEDDVDRRPLPQRYYAPSAMRQVVSIDQRHGLTPAPMRDVFANERLSHHRGQMRNNLVGGRAWDAHAIFASNNIPQMQNHYVRRFVVVREAQPLDQTGG